MSVLRDRRVSVLLVLVLVGSALSVVLALTRSDAGGAAEPPPVVRVGGPAYETAELLGPGGDALEAAVAAVPLAFGYDHRRLDADLEAATATMTRVYADSFARAFDRRVRPFAQRRRAVAEAVVRGAGVVRTRDDTTALCLVYVDQLLVGARGRRAGAEPELLAANRVLVDLVLRDGRWRVDGITTVRPPS